MVLTAAHGIVSLLLNHAWPVLTIYKFFSIGPFSFAICPNLIFLKHKNGSLLGVYSRSVACLIGLEAAVMWKAINAYIWGL